MKRALVAGMSLMALGIGVMTLRTRGRRSLTGLRRSDRKPAFRRVEPPEAADAAMRYFIAYVVLPVGAMAGVADWACHLRTDIAETGGPKETLLHLLMLSEAATPSLAALFLEIEPPVLALMASSFLLHEATTLWDVSYAVTRRPVTPIEQEIHSVQQMIPAIPLALAAVRYWSQRQSPDRGAAPARGGAIRLRRDISTRPHCSRRRDGPAGRAALRDGAWSWAAGDQGPTGA